MASETGAVARLWDLFEAREWEAAREQLHDDFVAEWPHTGERIVGADAFIDLNRNYPEPWSIEVRRVLAASDEAAAEVAVRHRAGASFCAGFYELERGRIRRAREYWVDFREQEAPEWRARWVEPMAAP